MSEKQIAPYGAWKSPITADLIVSGSVGLGQVRLRGEDTYWVESRPQEAGRNVLIHRRADGTREELAPAPFNVRTRVHEYGGGAYVVADDGTVYASNFSDQRLYRLVGGQAPAAVTPPGPWRYADACLDPVRELLICVRETHPVGGGEVVNELVAIDLAPQPAGDTEGAWPRRPPQVLASGYDFYASPRLSPDGTQLCWLCWRHPNMPWDGTELWLADLRGDRRVSRARCLGGGAAEAICQPEWGEDGGLFYVSDVSGWWNLYRQYQGRTHCLLPMSAEFAEPAWVFGMSRYVPVAALHLLCACGQGGEDRLLVVDAEHGELEALKVPYTVISSLHVAGRRAVFIGAAADRAAAVVELDLTTGHCRELARSTDELPPRGYQSHPELVSFPTANGQQAHAWFYPPANQDYAAPAGELPPLIVKSHGGPTSVASPALRLGTQYWTSRGFAVVDVNYGGSSGFGREYRERLNGQWGVVDVDDCVSAARYLVASGRVDGNRLAISGGSAGGFTTLAALAFRDCFKAGASHYGIGDLEALARDTHKFESHYLDRLIGPYPEARALYQARSPLHHVEGLNCPVVFFQGLDDQIVPPNQAATMVAALRAKGLPVAYVTFPGEQHGFRQAASIKRALEGELYFYSRVFGFALAEPVEPLAIEGLAGG